MLDDLNQVTAAVALRAPDLCETVPEGRRELCKNRQAQELDSTYIQFWLFLLKNTIIHF